MGRIKRTRLDNLLRAIENGKHDKLLSQVTSKDNQERRNAYQRAFNTFQWRCLKTANSSHDKESRAAFLEVFKCNIAGGLAEVAQKWHETFVPITTEEAKAELFSSQEESITNENVAP